MATSDTTGTVLGVPGRPAFQRRVYCRDKIRVLGHAMRAFLHALESCERSVVCYNYPNPTPCSIPTSPLFKVLHRGSPSIRTSQWREYSVRVYIHFLPRRKCHFRAVLDVLRVYLEFASSPFVSDKCSDVALSDPITALGSPYLDCRVSWGGIAIRYHHMHTCTYAMPI